MKYLLAFLLVFSFIGHAGDLKDLKVGEAVPSFTLKNYDGKDYDLKKVLKENKYAVVMFISTECPVSNGYNERMVKLNETFGKKGVAFLGINANKEEDVKRIAAHSKEHGFKFPVLKDVQNKVADLYAAQVTPETFVINTEGKLVYHGRIDDSRTLSKVTTNDLADALDKLLAGKTLTAATSKAFGCSIKRVD
ncbi:MAG: thioredoxin family protein [Ignavibacteriae bacterium]|nr:thioredoxin family protein [Ignavibacteria bacterium]MBI3365482.1 thioredoxin family protein [Ignavibacteriota bacterium]